MEGQMTSAPAPKADLLKATIDGMLEEMAKVEIKTDQEYEFAKDWLKRNADTQKLVTATFEDERVRTKAAYDDVLARRALLNKPLEQSEKIMRDKMSAYLTEKERVRLAEVRRLEEEERKRKEDDRLVEAQNLSSMGRVQEASDLLNKKITVKVDAPAAIGKSIKKWVVTVTDRQAFLKFVGMAHLEIQACVDVSEVKLAAYAQKQGGLNCPGIKAEEISRPVL